MTDMPDTHFDRRRYDLDWLRVIAFAILIFYHIGMFYVTWDWHVKSVHAGPYAEWAMRVVNPWRLSLLFFISGVAARFAADKMTAGTFARKRLRRLGIPILFGMAVIVAPQSYFELVESGEFVGGFARFWPQYLDPASSFSVTTPTWNHLWYVVYLLVYCLMVAPFAGVIARLMAGNGEAITKVIFSGRLAIVAVALLPALPHLVYRTVLDPLFPTTHDLTSDWANHAHSFTIFLTGFFLAKDRSFWQAIDRARYVTAGASLILIVFLTPLWADFEALFMDGGPYETWIWPVRYARVLYAWLVIAALLGWGQRLLNRPSAALSYMTVAIFPWYILHQTLIVAAGYWLTRQDLSAPLEFILVCTATIGGCLIIHEVFIRRIGFVRPLFGVPSKASDASPTKPVVSQTAPPTDKATSPHANKKPDGVTSS
ncbi:MAG: acyltransferase family protein [Pseudomonadota bacterium]